MHALYNPICVHYRFTKENTDFLTLTLRSMRIKSNRYYVLGACWIRSWHGFIVVHWKLDMLLCRLYKFSVKRVVFFWCEFVVNSEFFSVAEGSEGLQQSDSICCCRSPGPQSSWLVLQQSRSDSTIQTGSPWGKEISAKGSNFQSRKSFYLFIFINPLSCSCLNDSLLT